MLDFVESIASETGLPVGIKSAVGDSTFWGDLARSMASGTRGVDFITIDGGEGGSGAGPLVFTDHVALPLKVGFSRVQKVFTAHGLHERIVFIGPGKLGFPEATVFAFALGCDAVNVGREAMMAIGCIQAQRGIRITARRVSPLSIRGWCEEWIRHSRRRGWPITSSRCGKTSSRCCSTAVSVRRRSPTCSDMGAGSACRPRPIARKCVASCLCDVLQSVFPRKLTILIGIFLPNELDQLHMKWRPTGSSVTQQGTLCLISLLPVMARAPLAAWCRS